MMQTRTKKRRLEHFSEGDVVTMGHPSPLIDKTSDEPLNDTGANRRLVVFIGPPKTASTTLQSFFSKYASNSHSNTKASVFQNWNYPFLLKDPNGLKEIRHGPNHSLFWEIQKEILEQPPEINLLLGSEFLIQFETCHTLEYLQNWTNVTPEVVIMYRSPRMSHFLSIWKQQTKVGRKEFYGYSFRDFLCSQKTQEKVLEKLSVIANPLGLAKTAVGQNWPTFLLDMGGLDGQDVSHAFGCDILKVNCQGQWMEGLQGVTIRKNSRWGDPNLTEGKQLELENIFTQRDCTYYDELHNHPLLTILYRRHLWENNCTNTGVSAEPKFRHNVTNMLNQMRAILGCATTTATATNDDEVHTEVHATTTMEDMQSNIPKATRTINPTNATSNVTKVISTSTQLELGGSLTSRRQWMELVALLFVLLVFGYRRRKHMVVFITFSLLVLYWTLSSSL
jgi:hypothetical protein